MTTEVRQSLVVEAQPPLDADQAELLARIDNCASEVYRELTVPDPVFANLLARFEQTGELPDLRAHHADPTKLEEQEVRLHRFKKNILSDGLDPVLQQAYRWRINELIGNVRLATASYQGRMTTFERYNGYVYGRPNRQIAAATADWFRHQAEQHLDHANPAVRDAAIRVLRVVPDLNGSRDLLVPDPAVFEQVRAEHFRPGGHYTLLLAGVELPETGPITPTVGEPALRQVRANLQAQGYAIVDSAGASWSVSHIKKELQRPAGYSMPLERFVGLGPGHEWTHILEYINGLRSAVRLSGLGLDRYELGNEGRALIREQVMYQTFAGFAAQKRWQDVLRRHFSISLGQGATGEPQNFGQVYTVINAIDTMYERAKKPDNTAAADKTAHKRTTTLLRRTLKGTDGTGGAYHKDIVYLQGNVACWQAAADNSAIIEMGDRGKFDITNPRHLQLLGALGVLAP